jgi:hypothetical protein
MDKKRRVFKFFVVVMVMVLVMMFMIPVSAANGTFYVKFVVLDDLSAPVQGVDIEFNGVMQKTDVNGETTFAGQTGGMNNPFEVFQPFPANLLGDGHFQITYDVTYGASPIIETPPWTFFAIIEFNNQVDGIIIDTVLSPGDVWDITDISYVLVNQQPNPQTGERTNIIGWILLGLAGASVVLLLRNKQECEKS